MTTPCLNRTYHLLIVEDSDEDAMVFRQLLSAQQCPSFTMERAKTLESGLERLTTNGIDLVLLDLNLPDSVGIESFERFHEKTTLPIIVFSGLDDESVAIMTVHKGAQDYIVKWDTNRKMLTRAILYAIERKRLLRELERAQAEIRELRSFIPICAYCRRVHHDEGYWQNLEAYIKELSHIDFSHGICPDCFDKLQRDHLPKVTKELERERREKGQ